MPTLDCTLGIQSYPIRRGKRPSARRKHPYPFTFRETPLFTSQDLLEEDEDHPSPTPSFHRSRSPSLDHRPLPDSARTSVLEQDPFYFAPSSPAKSSASSQASLRRSIAGRKSGVQRSTRRSCVQRRRGEHRVHGATHRAPLVGDTPRPVFNPVNWGGAAGDAHPAEPNYLSPTQPAHSSKTSLSFILNAPDEEALWRRPWGSADGPVPARKESVDSQVLPTSTYEACENQPSSPPMSASPRSSERADPDVPSCVAHFDAPICVAQSCFPKIPLPPLLIDLSLDDEGDIEDDGPLQLQYPDSASPHAESPEELTVPIARKWQTNPEKDAPSDSAMQCGAEKDGASSAIPMLGSPLTVAQAVTGDRPSRPLTSSEDGLNDPGVATKKPPQSNNSPTDPTDPFINSNVNDYERPKPDFALHPLVESDPALLGPAILVFNDLVDAPKGPGKKPRIPRDTKFALKVNARAKQGEIVKEVAKVAEDATKVKEDVAKVEGAKAEARRPYYREEVEEEEAKKPCVVGPRIPEPVFRARKAKAAAPPQTVTASALSSGDVKKGDTSKSASSSASLPQPATTPLSGPVFPATSEPFPANPDLEIRSRRGRPLRPQQREARARRDAIEQQKKAVLLAFRDAAAKARRRVGIFRAMVRAMEDTMGMEDVKWGRVGKVRDVADLQAAEGCQSVIDGGRSLSPSPVFHVTTSSGQQSPSIKHPVECGPLHHRHGTKSSEDRLLALAESALSASCQQETTSLAKALSRASLESQSPSGSSHLGGRPRRISLQAYLKRKRECASDSEGDNKRCRRG
ncbi:uncharacterized protein SCHCODRAFT_02570823 [Schizophyllum commune H4-8]|uniref:uncharacterized protein n=1 Tax=Schizophyllum commune (strain H4-8 / FGSC 9210) TaxID=578458 RepID=UPI002160D6DB|nr:uncharacterized protein SCHCODRAFT_02570823 [Schizophyllum commune H4-8]KAI5897231.1 hypothetical protein SCHCODRAFT_02570823 [Schizophyllum commune H4-8]